MTARTARRRVRWCWSCRRARSPRVRRELLTARELLREVA